MHNLPANISCNVNLESSYTVTSLSGFSFILVLLLLCFYSRGDEYTSSFGYPSNLVVLFFGVLLATVTSLSVPQNYPDIYGTYVIITLCVIGILMTLIGSKIFFVAPVNALERPLGFYHSDMSLIIWVVTIPLVLLELFVFIGAVTYKVDKYLATIKSIGLFQKLVQASVYHFSLRLKVPARDKKLGAAWYLVVLSFFNFAMWLDSIMTSHDGNLYIEELFGKGFSIITSACNALLIDYRLFCCLLFAEHALEIGSEEEEESDIDENEDEEDDDSSLYSPLFKVNISQMSGFGYVIGFCCIAFQLVCGLQYANFVGSWTNVFPMLADALVIIFGFLLLKLSGSIEFGTFGKWRETNSKAVDIMVAVMGITGFVFWVIKTILNAVWAIKIIGLTSEQLEYLEWSVAKNGLRSVGILFQLYFFIKSDPFIGCRKNVKKNALSYLILPALMLSLLSVFIMTVIDSYTGIVEGLIEHSGISEATMALLKAGEPIHLGFCLHLFLHFFIINNNMRTKKTLVRKKTSRPASRATVLIHHDGDSEPKYNNRSRSAMAKLSGLPNVSIKPNNGLLEPLLSKDEVTKQARVE
ncbi:uncharacterized protein LOC130622446 [Hydractinia symbiolongicarpus]|uniref:uncharacterized protein LOC130622446 n=1 Tax=Hydractinia symbiolongicarpus TaxID=13093 RepID=UPI00254F7B11|nr:uncharacterized protein LOC130622446 [Hydractinia symbiolongicarpus]